MNLLPLEIDPDIRRAHTLPGAFYRSQEIHDLLVQDVFPGTWQLVAASHEVAAPGRVAPWVFMEGAVHEPLLVVRDAAGEARLLSNACTHRGNLLVSGPGPAGAALRCRYHGRRFDLEGHCTFMPEFEGVVGFPGVDDNLSRVPVAAWGPFLFASLAPVETFDSLLGPVRSRLSWLPLDRLRLDSAASRSYHVQASWALYCDNYLEGFHIPYVHPGLAGALDYKTYRTETFPLCSLQIGEASGGEEAFQPPPGHPDGGRRLAGYYLFLFPSTMLNFYPWGVSVNMVLPQGPDTTRIDYLAYVWDETRRGRGAGGDLHTVEMEDESVVESVQQGIRARLYRRGRYSPSREGAVHHFHRLLARSLNDAWARRSR